MQMLSLWVSVPGDSTFPPRGLINNSQKKKIDWLLHTSSIQWIFEGGGEAVGGCGLGGQLLELTFPSSRSSLERLGWPVSCLRALPTCPPHRFALTTVGSKGNPTGLTPRGRGWLCQPPLHQSQETALGSGESPL